MKIVHLSRYILISLILMFLAEANCHAADEEHTPLGEQMEQIGRAWRMVKRGASDASKNAQTLAQVNKMQAAVENALQHTPAMLEDIPDSERKKFLGDYFKGMKNFEDSLDKLEALLKAGNNAAATELITQIDDHRKKSHNEFKRDE